jgi:hypothetical protein
MFLGVELEKIPVGVRNITLLFDDFTVTVIVPSSFSSSSHFFHHTINVFLLYLSNNCTILKENPVRLIPRSPFPVRRYLRKSLPANSLLKTYPHLSKQ